MFLSFYL